MVSADAVNYAFALLFMDTIACANECYLWNQSKQKSVEPNVRNRKGTRRILKATHKKSGESQISMQIAYFIINYKYKTNAL